jgi:RNA polymerase sigma factor (TIGR02999 family)
MTVRDDQPDVSRSEKNAADVHSAIDSDAASRQGGLVGSPTRILSRLEAGDASASDQLFPLVYDELRRLAARRLDREEPGQTLTATALVHEVYLRLVDVERDHVWKSRAHFFGAAAEAMRRVLIERARGKRAQKRGGRRRRVPLCPIRLAIEMPPDQLLALDEVLEQLAQLDTRAVEIVKLRCFAGLPIEQVAELLNTSTRTAYREWAYARAWIYRQLRNHRDSPAE